MTERQQYMLTQYLTGALDESEAAELNTLLKNDPDFQQHFTALQITLHRQLLRNELIKPPVKTPYLRWLSWGGILLVIVAVFIRQCWIQTELSNEAVQIALIDFHPQPNFVTQSNQVSPELTTFETQYRSAANAQVWYDSALQIIKTLPNSRVSQYDSIKYRFFEGVCLIKKSNPDLNGAISIFEDIVQKDNGYVPESLWLLSLAYALTGDWVKCEASARLIPNNSARNQGWPVDRLILTARKKNTRE